MPVLRAVVVHHCPLFRLGLRSFLLRQQRCTLVGEATSREAVLRLACQEHPDLVLLDAGLHLADPLELVLQLAQMQIAVVVFASLLSDEVELFQYFLLGAAAYLPGTITETELLGTMHQVMQGACLFRHDALIPALLLRERLARWHAVVRQQPASLFCPLSDGERTLLQLASRGSTTPQLAQELGLSASAIKGRLATIMKKLGVWNRTEAVVTALREQWITLDDSAAQAIQPSIREPEGEPYLP